MAAATATTTTTTIPTPRRSTGAAAAAREGVREYTVYFDVHPRAQTSLAMFRALATPLLMHPLGWAQYADKYKLDVVSQMPANKKRNNFIHVTLMPQDEMDRKFPDFKDDRLSVCNIVTLEIAINETRWLRLIPDKSELQLPAYRAYVIQHEVGHALGHHKHETACVGPDQKTPIMMQQTKGPGQCTPYPFPSEA